MYLFFFVGAAHDARDAAWKENADGEEEKAARETVGRHGRS